MPALASRLDPRSAAFAANAARMHERLAEVRALEAKVVAESASKAEKFAARGQLLPRERVARLLDRGSDFLELSPLAGLGMHDDDGRKSVLGGGAIVGIGTVAGRRVMVSASDSAVKGGTVAPMGLKKALRAQELARENKLPLVALVESGGANLMYQAEIFVDGGRSFANQARLSAAGIPQIAVVHGSSTAGGAYLPGLSDYVVLVRGRSTIYLAGPPLVKAAIGEDATDEELGGAELHAQFTGLGEYLAEDDAHAIQITRELLARLPWDTVAAPPPAPEPLYPAEELMGIVPADERTPYDVREVVARLVDGSEFLEFKAGYAPDTVCGHARLMGHDVGLVGNNGPIQPAGSTKAAQFMQLCDQSGTPLVFLQNTTGYMVGREAERAGAIKHGSKMIQAVANVRVPKFTVVLGGSYGAGNYGMCGRGFDPRFIFAWPSARTAVMGGAQAAQVMDLLNRQKLKRLGLPADETALAAMSDALRRRLDAESTALFGTARLWDDGIVDPRDTRRVLGLCLSIAEEAGCRQLRPNSYGVARF
ncbi:acyl-CoA carboxylase subunit beta [Rubrivivax gelatinosus]|uniref:Geranyl-CoA carboxylase beta subunit n=1 Tax=Rubrivivax gelatinosus TaxID=28068 RepID=A0A4R2MVX6_RUBGE|nr:carboxyl transferase domain-containing protein [Rubrivivax gelatinosus]MBK1685983.1 acetyl-CoA carboxylase carboxyltransferase subunit [Rubrivivax gelatinosus]TCP03993.1 geranyl-CoA carboxylase beta subunit [Rubrivivax gelatinosus]